MTTRHPRMQPFWASLLRSACLFVLLSPRSRRRSLPGRPAALRGSSPCRSLRASVHSRIATGPRAGQRVLRFGDPVEVEEREVPSSPCCVTVGGVSVHAEVGVSARDRRRPQRLCRYTGPLRPAHSARPQAPGGFRVRDLPGRARTLTSDSQPARLHSPPAPRQKTRDTPACLSPMAPPRIPHHLNSVP